MVPVACDIAVTSLSSLPPLTIGSLRHIVFSLHFSLHVRVVIFPSPHRNINIPMCARPRPRTSRGKNVNAASFAKCSRLLAAPPASCRRGIRNQ